jgi:hypothetical protein
LGLEVEEERAGEGEAKMDVDGGWMLSSALSSGGGAVAFRLERVETRLVAELDRD